MSTFNTELAEKMFDSNVSFETILHIPTLSVGRPSESFKEFIESCADNKDLDEFAKTHKGFAFFLKQVQEDEDAEYAEEHASNLSMYCQDFEFIVQTQTSQCSNFRFNEEGKFLSCSVGGWYRLNWIVAKDMNQAAVIAISNAEMYFQQDMAKEKAQKQEKSHD